VITWKHGVESYRQDLVPGQNLQSLTEKGSMRLKTIVSRTSIFAVLALVPFVASAQTSPQTNGPATPEEVPPMLRPKAPIPDPATPKARPFYDARYGVSFTVPTAWNLNRKDAEVSTFNLDARNAAHNAQLRAVASISFNPHPTSTFSGALFYYSVAPHTTAAQCTAQAIARAPRTVTTEQIDGVPFTHGYEEHGSICTESRDEIYTTERDNACYRFDAVINSFCGGDVSGVRDIMEDELDAVRSRMQRILSTVHFDPK
jgi:hypothetical protein